jgi:hypothetical protein
MQKLWCSRRVSVKNLGKLASSYSAVTNLFLRRLFLRCSSTTSERCGAGAGPADGAALLRQRPWRLRAHCSRSAALRSKTLKDELPTQARWLVGRPGFIATTGLEPFAAENPNSGDHAILADQANEHGTIAGLIRHDRAAIPALHRLPMRYRSWI